MLSPIIDATGKEIATSPLHRKAGTSSIQQGPADLDHRLTVCGSLSTRRAARNSLDETSWSGIRPLARVLFTPSADLEASQASARVAACLYMRRPSKPGSAENLRSIRSITCWPSGWALSTAMTRWNSSLVL